MEIGVEEAMYTLRNGEEFPASSGFGGSGDGHRMLVWEGADIEPFRQADGCVLSLLCVFCAFFRRLLLPLILCLIFLVSIFPLLLL